MTLAWPLTWSPAMSSWPNWKCKDKVGQKLAELPGSMGCASSQLEKGTGKVLHLGCSSPLQQGMFWQMS